MEHRYNKVPKDRENVFVTTGFCYIGVHFTVTLTGRAEEYHLLSIINRSGKNFQAQNIICYSGDFIIKGFVLSGFHCMMQGCPSDYYNYSIILPTNN